MGKFLDSSGAVADLMTAAAHQHILRNLAEIDMVLRGLGTVAPDLTQSMRREIIDFIVKPMAFQSVEQSSNNNSKSGSPETRGEFAAARNEDQDRKSRHIEKCIMEILEADEDGVPLEEVYDRLQDMEAYISRGALSVRLHRMVKSGTLISPLRSIYALTPVEWARRQVA